MKKIINIALLVPFLFAFSCEETKEMDSEENPTVSTVAIIGQWQLIETLADPGDSSGTFQPVTNGEIIEFKEDNSVVGLNTPNCGNLDNMSVVTYIEKDQKITFSNCNNFSLGVDFKQGNLLLLPPCFEPCANKYKKI